MSDQPLISLAMIVRNEEASLPRVLGAHRGLWDQAVVVDTGSDDATARVAREMGADVFAFPWCDDFSAARNAALARCRGRWVLILDADEHIAPPDLPTLRSLVAGAEPAGLILPQWNYADDAGLPGWCPVGPGTAAEADGAQGYVIAHQVRLFPGGPATRYRGRVHETVEPSLLAQGLPLVRVAVPVHHHGHRVGVGAVGARRARDGRLLRMKLADDPQDPRTRYEMAAQLLAEGRSDLARRLLETLVAESPGGPRAADAYRLLGRLALASGDEAQARAACASAVGVRPDLPENWLDLVRVNWITGDRRGARQALDQMARLFPLDPRLAALTAQVQAPDADNGSGQAGGA